MSYESRGKAENKLVRVGMIGAVLLLVAFVAYMLVPDSSRIKVTIGPKAFDALLADTDESRAVGLTHLDTLEDGKALLVVYDADDTWPVYTKDMKFPVDIAWIDKDHDVAFVARGAKPSNTSMFRPGSKVRYVLQLPVGSLTKYNIGVGTQVEFTHSKGE